MVDSNRLIKWLDARIKDLNEVLDDGGSPSAYCQRGAFQEVKDWVSKEEKIPRAIRSCGANVRDVDGLIAKCEGATMAQVGMAVSLHMPDTEKREVVAGIIYGMLNFS